MVDMLQKEKEFFTYSFGYIPDKDEVLDYDAFKYEDDECGVSLYLGTIRLLPGSIGYQVKESDRAVRVDGLLKDEFRILDDGMIIHEQSFYRTGHSLKIDRRDPIIMQRYGVIRESGRHIDWYPFKQTESILPDELFATRRSHNGDPGFEYYHKGYPSRKWSVEYAAIPLMAHRWKTPWSPFRKLERHYRHAQVLSFADLDIFRILENGNIEHFAVAHSDSYLNSGDRIFIRREGVLNEEGTVLTWCQYQQVHMPWFRAEGYK